MPVINEKIIPDGYSGTAETIKQMWKLVNKESKDQHLRNIARKITENVTAKDYFGEAKALFDFVKGRTKFVRDPEGAERIADPFITLTEKAGDCDDHAILIGGLAETIGFPVRFVTVSTIRPGFFNHVYAEIYVPSKGWLPADTTEKESYLGWDPKTYFTKQVWNDLTERNVMNDYREQESIGIADLGKAKIFRKALKLTPAYFTVRKQEKKEKKKTAQMRRIARIATAKTEAERKKKIDEETALRVKEEAETKQKEADAKKAEEARVAAEKLAILQAQTTYQKAADVVVAKQEVKEAQATGQSAEIELAKINLNVVNNEYVAEVHSLVQTDQNLTQAKQAEVVAKAEIDEPVVSEPYAHAQTELEKQYQEEIQRQLAEGVQGLGKLKLKIKMPSFIKKLVPSALKALPMAFGLPPIPIKIPTKKAKAPAPAVAPEAAVAPGEEAPTAPEGAPASKVMTYVLIGVGTVTVLGTIIYFITRKK